MIKTFSELTETQLPLAGGKGGVLAKLFQAGYPVPDGFVILPEAFDGNGLKPEAWPLVLAQLEEIRQSGNNVSFAVRSSALSEDSAQASFGGQFETVLDVRTDEAIREAIQTVYDSRLGERVRAYTEAKGMEISEGIAVVVQQLVRSDIAGVLFTADPVTGSRNVMTGNYIYGLGDRLVSGEADAETFTLARPKGKYEGPQALKRHASQLYKLSAQLERDLGSPQDIEWAIADGRLTILQSRPITTLIGHNPATGEWNDSLTGDYLWVLSAWGENMPGVMTPSTWSVWQRNPVLKTDWDTDALKGTPGLGNICGRVYMNFTLMQSVVASLRGAENSLKLLESLFGELPNVEMPLMRFRIRDILAAIPQEMQWQKKVKALWPEIPAYIAASPGRCREIQRKIRATQAASDLIPLWHDEVEPHFVDAGWMLKVVNEKYMGPLTQLTKDLVKLVGKEDADVLTSTIGGASTELASLGLMTGLAKIARGEMTREEYLERFGHRFMYEWHLYHPRPSENPSWLDERLADLAQSPVDVNAILQKRQDEFGAAWQRFEERYPRKAKATRRKLEDFAAMSHDREEIRSELTRAVALVRAFFLRAGELTGLGDGVFFLSIEELLDVLAGEDAAVEFIPARRETYEKYCALPPYPAAISGRFDPFAWAADPNRRMDVFDSHAPITDVIEDPGIITGNPGSAGRVEGIARIILTADDGDQLRPGEILVAPTTNVGWTPIFPKAVAVVTDVGAPLAHAAIVARELGIPAVVGCGDATMRLRTGDRVMVDGGQGIVQILENNN
jgi:phosphohistidine swiveling domain-containing protein